MNDTIIVAIITGVISLVLAMPGMLALRTQIRRTRAETALSTAEAELAEVDSLAKLAEAWEALLEPQQQRIKQLEDLLKRERNQRQKLETRVSDLEDLYRELDANYKAVVSGASLLYHQVVALKEEPLYVPPGIGKKDNNDSGLSKKTEA